MSRCVTARACVYQTVTSHGCRRTGSKVSGNDVIRDDVISVVMATSSIRSFRDVIAT